MARSPLSCIALTAAMYMTVEAIQASLDQQLLGISKDVFSLVVPVELLQHEFPEWETIAVYIERSYRAAGWGHVSTYYTEQNLCVSFSVFA